MRRGKRYKKAKSMIEPAKHYDLDEAISVVKEISTNPETKAKFEESIDIVYNLNLKQQHTIRDSLMLPHPILKKKKRILVFAKGEKAKEAQEAGADYVGDTDLIEKIKKGWLEFDVVIATPDMMKDVSKLGPILGRRGLMPNPKAGTLTFNIKEAIEDFKKGKVEYKTNKQKEVYFTVGTASMEPQQIRENVLTTYKEILKKRPSDLKGEFIKSAYISPTMGPGVRISLKSLSEAAREK